MRSALTGTLRCHFRHRVHDDPYVNIGLQDITAWVDFTRLAQAGDAAGLTVAGFATQAAFLLAHRARDVRGRGGGRSAAGAACRGGAPAHHARGDGRGVQGVGADPRDLDAPLAGFALQDLRHLL